MQYYHGSPIGDLTVLEPRKPAFFDKPSRVYLTSSFPMALMYGIRNFEYTYGYTKDREIFLEEYFPGALEQLYGGKSAFVYLCRPEAVQPSRIPNEWISETPVEILDVIEIPDLLAEMKRQEALGALALYPYETLSPKRLEWIKNAEAGVIREANLLHTPGPFADYIKTHYPASWEMALSQEEPK